MKKILLFVLPFLALVAVSGEKDGKELSGNDIIEFKDPNFLKALLTVQEIYLYDAETDEEIPYMMDVDLNKDGKISVNEAQKVKGLALYNEETAELFNIREIPEIKYFTALTCLHCEGNQLTSLDLSKNTALTYLSCDCNQLTYLNVSKNTALTYLACYYNQLTTLDVSKNTALTHLNCSGNQLTTLDVSKNTALTDLDCSGNQLTTLDVSKNTALTDLDCSVNQLTTLDVSGCTALTHLNCRNNQLTTLDVSGCTALTNLHCPGNQLIKLILPTHYSEYYVQDIINEYGNIIEYR